MLYIIWFNKLIYAFIVIIEANSLEMRGLNAYENSKTFVKRSTLISETLLKIKIQQHYFEINKYSITKENIFINSEVYIYKLTFLKCTPK